MPRAAEEVFRVSAMSPQEAMTASCPGGIQPVPGALFLLRLFPGDIPGAGGLGCLAARAQRVRDLGRGALMRQEVGAGKALPRQAMEEWARSDLDVWEDTAGNTTVKGLTYIEVRWTSAGGHHPGWCVRLRAPRVGVSCMPGLPAAGHAAGRANHDHILPGLPARVMSMRVALSLIHIAGGARFSTKWQLYCSSSGATGLPGVCTLHVVVLMSSSSRSTPSAKNRNCRSSFTGVCPGFEGGWPLLVQSACKAGLLVGWAFVRLVASRLGGLWAGLMSWLVTSSRGHWLPCAPPHCDPMAMRPGCEGVRQTCKPVQLICSATH
ncbi:hypothetical protein HaLaN_10607 [Haematococcus lacustris]|uniref:Uncharacterized protein n=1 Tax=Haematococcus lacustris TaxID=44745 RepID=A0A699Z6M5_HAELA|nr:hypothetical protein HaLaN_10607 [Haematococcus lacustris]